MAASGWSAMDRCCLKPALLHAVALFDLLGLYGFRVVVLLVFEVSADLLHRVGIFCMTKALLLMVLLST